ncbi:MAG: GxxExxY protein [Saprospiraceae bacterium]
MRKLTKKYLDELTFKIIGVAIEVHKILGPGLMESDYEDAFKIELGIQNLKFVTQKTVERAYKGHPLKGKLRFDVLVEDAIVVEIKAIRHVLPIHEAITMSYMKHLKVPKGILINFHVNNIFHEGQKTFVNEYYAQLPDE